MVAPFGKTMCAMNSDSNVEILDCTHSSFFTAAYWDSAFIGARRAGTSQRRTLACAHREKRRHVMRLRPKLWRAGGTLSRPRGAGMRRSPIEPHGNSQEPIQNGERCRQPNRDQIFEMYPLVPCLGEK